MGDVHLAPGTVLVLAAGFGTRLGELTHAIPKAMVAVDGQPNLARILDRLALFGARQVVVNTHYKPEPIRALMASGEWSFEVHESWEPEIMGTGGALAAARPRLEAAMDELGEEAFWIINCDVICDFDPLDATCRQQTAQLFDAGCRGILLLRHDEKADSYGAFARSDEGLVRSLPGRPGVADDLMFTGIQMIHRSGLQQTRQQFGSIFEQVYWPAWDRGEPIGALVHHGAWFDVGTPESRTEAERWLSGC